MDEPNAKVTQILQELDERDEAPEELLAIVYDSLKRIARSRMAEERAGHTLQATALVHEAVIRLLGRDADDWESRRHFFGAAAEAMRRILIDHARRKGARKRGGGQNVFPLTDVDLAETPDLESVLQLDEALTRLEAEDPRAASVVKLRFFAGLSVEETTQALGLSERTVMREWAFARARLHQLLGEEPEESEET